MKEKYWGNKEKTEAVGLKGGSDVDRRIISRAIRAISEGKTHKTCVCSVYIMIFLILLPVAFTSIQDTGNAVVMELEAQQIPGTSDSPGYMLTLKLYSNPEMISANETNQTSPLTDTSLNGLDFSQIYDLIVTKDTPGTIGDIGSVRYKYFGKLQFPISYNITEIGNYSFRLYRQSDASLISESYFNNLIDDGDGAIDAVDTGINDDHISGNITDTENGAENLYPTSDPYNDSYVDNGSDIQDTHHNNLTALDRCSQIYAGISKENYSIGETVDISVVNMFGNLVDLDLSIIAGNSQYRFIGESGSAVFIPTEKGVYELVLSCDGSKIFDKKFNIDMGLYDQGSNISENTSTDVSDKGLVSSDKGSISGENNGIDVPRDPAIRKDVTIKASDGRDTTYSAKMYNVKKVKKVISVDTLGDNHTLINIDSLNDDSNESIADNSTLFLDNSTASNNSTALGNSTLSLDNFTASNISLDNFTASNSSIASGNSTLFLDNFTASNISLDNSSISDNSTIIVPGLEMASMVEIELLSGSGFEAIKDSKIALSDVVYEENSSIDIFIEEVPRVDVNFDGNVLASFAMDLSNLNFTNGTFTKKAIGRELWKCAEWNYSGRTCDGSWIKVMDIDPGSDYLVEVSPVDPAYVETGVSTVNTLKSLYYPNETVDIFMVILDTRGYLVSGANISLTIISPDNLTTELTTDAMQIMPISNGVYETTFSGTVMEGDYVLIISSLAENVNSTMVSQFKVANNHTFDIYRETPVTIDPNRGPFNTNITITTSLPLTTFDYTEILPSSFDIIDSGDGVISLEGSNTYITWYGLTNGSSVVYYAQTPLDTPNVYEVGPGFIKYEYMTDNDTFNDTFYESRPWFLAIDPVFTGTFFMFWDGTSDAPAGWTCVSCNSSGAFYNRFIMSGATYGATGGSATHNHTINYVSETSGATVSGASFGGSNGPNRASGTHTHSDIDATTTNTVPNYPSFRQLKVIAYSGRVPLIIPAGAIGIFNTTSLPANWTQYSAQNNYFILANSSANITGGSNTHNHSVSITSSDSTGTTQSRNGGTPQNVAVNGHSHTGSGTTSQGSNMPPYIDVVLARADVNTTIPYGQGFIGMFNGSLGDGWLNASQNGQPFYNKTLRAAATYNATGGGVNISNHSNIAIVSSGPSANGTTSTGTGRTFATGTHTHNITLSFTNSSMMPPYISVVLGYANNSVLYPPVINRTDCYRQGSGWVNCTTVGYNSNLTAVRTNCYSDNPGGNVSNVTFVLRNIDQGITYFNVTVTNMTGAYWQYNLSSSLTFFRSGYHSLTIVCRENPETEADINWTVPWGNLSVQLVSPSSDMNVTRNRFFNFTTRVTCVGGECGDVNATLDPISNITAYSGSINDINGNDEEGGSYSSTAANDGVYYAIGEVDPATFGTQSANSQMILNFNISYLGISPGLINGLNLSLTYCHSGEDSYAAIDCNGDDAVEKTLSVVQDVWIYNFTGASWLDIGNLNTANGENDVTSMFSALGNMSDFVNSSGIITFRTEIVSDAGGAGTDAWLAVDQAVLGVDYISKDGAVSMVVGAIPFYTISANPMLPANRSCLGNMTAGSTCDTTWQVNATGPTNLTGTFFTIYDSLNFSSLVSEKNTSKVNITILDSVPPTINSVQCFKQGTGWTSCTNILFNSNFTDIRANCIATSGSTVTNVSFRFSNFEDNNTYFDVTTNTTSSGYWYYNITDILLRDSGLMTLNVTCMDTDDSVAQQLTNWTVPWGNLSVQFVSPNSSLNVTQYRFFNITSRVTCVGGECGDVNATLDPISNLTVFSGSIIDIDGNDEEGGSYSSTAANDNVYYAMGEVDPATFGTQSANSQMVLSFNISSLGILSASFINDLNFSLSYCHSGEDSYAAIDCNGDDAVEKTLSTIQDVWIYNLTGASWLDIGDLNTANGENEVTSIFSVLGNMSDFVNSSGIITFRTEIVTAAGGAGTDAWLAVDQAVLGVDFIGKSGAVSMIVGAIPFYTISANPMLPANRSCLGNMTAGSTCDTVWDVNATGPVDFTGTFFVIYDSVNYPSYVLEKNTSKINVTIMGNVAPMTRSAVLTPNEPVYYEDINCTFNITDQNNGDTLSATINWYRDGIFITSAYMSVTDGQSYTNSLDSSYLTTGDVWRCGVIPYDTIEYGSEVFSNNVTILASAPPIINSMECLRNGAVWVNCSGILYGNTLSKVRANCTSRLSTPVSVSFNLTNVEDSYLFFSGSTNDNSTGYWVFDNSDVTIADSGIFNLTATCVDINSTSRTNHTNWTVPWGVLNVSLINPTSNINVTQYKFFNFSTRVTCVGGECGYLNATIDPINWWNASWNYRRTVNLTERANQNLTNYQFNVTINTQSLISAGKMNDNCSDIRFTTNSTPSTLLSYWIESGCNSTSTLIWVKYNLTALAYNTIYMYYGNPDATNYSDAKSTMFLYEDMTVIPDGSIIGDAAYIDNNTGVRMTINDNYLLGYIYYAANPGPGFYGRYETWAGLGPGNGADSTWIGIYDTSVTSTREDIVYGGYHFTVDEWQDRIAFTKSTVDNGASIAEWGSTTLDDDSWHTLQTYFYHNGTSANALIYYDGVLRVNGTDNSPQSTSGQYFLFGARTGGSTNEHRIRGIQVRKYVRPEPLVALDGEVSQSKGIIPMYNGTPFYTITANPMLPANTSCLANMKSGDICNTTWEVNATGMLFIPWEFFVTYSSLNYSGKVVTNITKKVNVTIIGNIAPIVSSITLRPNYPLPSEDLNCSFNITDTNAPDILTANITWYRNNVYNRSSVVSVTNGVINSVILGSGNLTLGETWHCGALPYDQQTYGLQVNSTNQTVVNSKPPDINKLECYINNSVWTNCSRLGFYANISAVRVNCTTAYRPISNVTFNFSNTPDTKSFFNTVVTSNSSDYWTYYQNVTINDSGEFIMRAECTNNESASDIDIANWTVPWGRIVITLIDPNADGYVEYNKFFNFTAQLSCLGGECGNVTAILDPENPEGPIGGVKTFKPIGMMVESSDYDSGFLEKYSNYYSGKLLSGSGLSGDVDRKYTGIKFSGNPAYPNGLIVVDTDKADYRFGEGAKIYIVALDGTGDFYAPGNLTVSLSCDDKDKDYDLCSEYLAESGLNDLSGKIVELQRGIYSIETDSIRYSGKYLVSVSARYRTGHEIGGNDMEDAVVSDMISCSNSFTVKEDLDYMILRESPLAVNPWSGDDGLFTTKISFKIFDDEISERYPYNERISFTEIVPEGLDVKNPNGGKLWKKTIGDYTYTYIIWNDLIPDSSGRYYVSYTALPSKLSPDIYELRSFISMDGKILEENRPWKIAVDPTNYYSAYGGSYAMTTTSGASASGGSYTNTDVRDCSGGTCTQSNSYVTGITGFTGSGGATCMMNVTLLFNISDIKTIYLNSMMMTWGGCWHGDSNLANPRCDGVNTPKFTTGTGGGTFDMWINRSGTLEKLDCVDSFNNECGVGNEINLGTGTQPPSWGGPEDYHTYTFSKDVFNSSYVNNGTVMLRWRSWAVGACGDGGGTNILMALDYANLSVNWSYLIKNGTMISMVPGTEPFYTITSNPTYPVNNSCLADMLSGKSCNLTWEVNATGGVNTTHVFYVIGNATNYNTTVASNVSTSIKLTIRDTSTVPPTVTLNSPANNYSTQNTNMIFNCSAVDNSGLVNMTLYGSFSGTFGANSTNDISGLSNTTTFSFEVFEGMYLWNCMAVDTDGNTRFAASNRTLTIDYTSPSINLSYPNASSNVTTRTVAFNFTVLDNLDSSMTCNLTLDSVIEHQNFSASNNSITSKTVANLSQGNHYWNVTCFDDALNSYISETRSFTVLNTPPVLTLQTVDNYMTNNSFVELYYFTDDGGYITQADLYINGLLNYTDYDVQTGYTNLFDVVGLTEGAYTWTVNVTNNGGLTAQASPRTFFIDRTAPTLNVSFPTDNYISDYSTVPFNFTAIDNFDSMMACKITINGVDVVTGINANNNSMTSRNASNIQNGLNYWNITCVDDAGNKNVSETRVLNVSAIPTVVLNNPANNSFQKSENITLYYTPSGSNNMSNCSLILDGAVDQTDYTITLGSQNNFRLINLPEKSYNWSVNCTDTTGYIGSSATRVFTIDKTPPYINLTWPINGETAYGTTTNFNFTAYDALDPLMTCSLIIDGSVNRTGISAPNGQPVNISIPVAEGIHTWSINCTDRALNLNNSATESFEVIGAPTVTLVYPGPNSYLNYSNDVNFTYIPSSGNSLINASLYINGVFNRSVDSPSNGVENHFYLNFTNEGKYNWSVMIIDSMNITGYSATNTFYIDTQPPVVTIISPTNGQNISVNNVSFRFNMTDNVFSPIICNVTVSGNREWENISVSNGSTITRSKIMYDGEYNWSVSCIDNASNVNTYSLINFTVEAPPNVTLNYPPQNFRTTLQNITFNYTPRDDIGLDICVLVINGVDNQNSTSVVRNVPNYFNITDTVEGDYNWTVRCTDSAPDSNVYAPTERNFTIDLTPPAINMISPGLGDSINSNTVQFNWTATDYPVNISCMLFIDDVYNRSITQMSGTYFTPTASNFTPGVHNWSLNCSDDLNNSLMGPTWNFTINDADLYLDTNRIYFNNTNPDENQTINISANVTNIGGVPASGVLVNFYDGDPSTGGTFIGNSTGNVAVNASVIFSTVWNITAGYHMIYISVDPYGAISELSELNNNATRNISFLRSVITDPLNNTGFAHQNVSFTFNLEDFTGGQINYTVFVDNVRNGQNGTVTDNVPETIDITFTQGVHSVKIEALDYLGRRKNSTAVVVTIDYTAPNATILTANNTWYNISTPNITVRATDNLDTNINYTIYASDVFNTAGNVSNNTDTQINLTALAEGYHELIMEAYDDFNNTANSSPVYIYVDMTPPNITLNSPGNGNTFTSRTVVLNYTPGDNLASTLACNLTLDGSIVSSQSLGNGNSTAYTANNLAEGTHYWNVTCRDQALNTNTSDTYSFNVYIPPVITLISPPNNNWSMYENNTFYFNVSDDTGLFNCSLLINGSVYATKDNSQLTNNATNNLTAIGLTSGNYTWAIECYDNSTYHSYNISGNRTLYVDLVAPQSYIETPDGSWFNVGNPLIRFNISDNMDQSLDYRIYVNDGPNVTGTISNGSSIQANLVGLTNGTYTVVVEGTDNAGNKHNSSSITIYVDSVVPSINLTNPLNDTNLTATTADLNFTVSDNMAASLNCNLTFDNSIIASNMTLNADQTYNVTVSDLLGGYHYWNVTCTDLALNRNTSQTYRFYVVMPDLYTNDTMIYFSNDAPIENETLNVTAEVSNIGLSIAQNFTVQIRVVNMSGTYNIYEENMTLGINESANVTTNYTLSIGNTTFFMLVDVPLATNGTVRESNESNNNASRSIYVSLWQRVIGYTNDRLTMTDITNQTIFDWIVSNASGSKIFAADIDSNINWRSLKALGINSSNQSSPIDFVTLDTALGSTTFSDSVNRTYTSGGSPIETTNYTIFARPVNYVPIVNSTNNANFKTGILWDYGDGGARFLGTQDILFVSPINKGAMGYNDTVDYEIRIPATLRSYRAGQNAVVFYAEIN